MITIDLSQIESLAPRMRDSYRQAFGSAGANVVLEKYGISETPLRVCHFLAQTLAETGALHALVESLDYSASRLMQVWPKRFPNLDAAMDYAHDEQKLGDFVYGGRLGNTSPGDGFKFRGRGLLQITGRAAYSRFGAQLGLPLTSDPDLAFAAPHCLEIAAAEWAVSGHDGRLCNALADADDVAGVTYAINGGQIGIVDRVMWLRRCKAIWLANATGPGTAPAASRALAQSPTPPADAPTAESYKNLIHPYVVRPPVTPTPEAAAGKCEPYFKRPQRKLSARIASGSHNWDVPALCRAYSWPTGLAGGGVIAVVELDGGWVQSDMDAFFQRIGQPAPQITDIVVSGPGNSPNQHLNDSGPDPDVEVTMDIQIAAAAYYVATGQPAVVNVYWADNQPGGIAAAVRRATSDGCDVCTISWGSDESNWKTWATPAQDFIQDMEQAAKAAAAAGMIVFAASGDNDSSDGGPDPANVDVPSSCPSVIGCGGTTKTDSSETVWNNAPGQTNGQGSGGGYSSVFPPPPWQAGAPQLGDHPPQRMVPDVTANADPNTGYEVLVHGNYGPAGGTSAVAPLYAGLFAAFGRKLGPASQTIWQNSSGFSDITQGGNGAFSAAVGPDPCSGLGAPIGSKLAALFTSGAQPAQAAMPPPPAAAVQSRAPATSEAPPVAPPAVPVARAMSPRAADGFDTEEAVRFGLFIEQAYAMYLQNTEDLTPPPRPDFPAGYRLTAWVQMQDFLLWSTGPKFYGFIAQNLAEPNRFVLALRGTEGAVEWFDDVTSLWQMPFKIPGCGSVSVGFNRIYETMEIVEAPPPPTPGAAVAAVAAKPRSLRSEGGFARQAAVLVRRHCPAPAGLLAAAPTPVLDVVGHSLGAALATLHALENAHVDKIENTVIYTFASPMVGDATFVTAFDALGLNSWRIVNRPDLVPMLPSAILGYEHVSTEKQFDSSGRVRPTLACWHSMATYLSVVDPSLPPGADCSLSAVHSALARAVAAARPATGETRTIEPRLAETPVEIAVDTDNNVTTFLPDLASGGVLAVGRYYSRFPRKVLTRIEAQAVSRANLTLFVVYEDGASPGDFDGDSGTFHAQQALRCAGVVGQPPNSAIYFAVDYNCGEYDIEQRILPYFQSIAAVFADRSAPYKLGVYGNGLLCGKLLDAGLCAYTWLSNSTSYNGTREFYQSKRWSLAQHLPKYYGRLQVDPNETAPDFGAFQVDPGAT